MNKETCKVCCNVCDCIHNEDGCVCNREEINVTNKNDQHHYCGSYCKK
ncbi:MAG: DUF1540 domain-containing protein [Clostridia bacterium]|nr:DUF1540 domain-containing protein [Clostridia bacterium]